MTPTLAVGTRIWNNGDMANPGHFATVTKVTSGNYGAHYEVTPDADSGRRPYTIMAMQLSPEFKGHSGTRIVTEAAYKAYYEAQRAAFLRSAGGVK